MTKLLNSLLYYTSVILYNVCFTSIKPTKHYLSNHKDFPWFKAVEIVLTTKNPRRKGSKFEIENDKYYVLFEIKNKTLYVINAKTK